MWHWCDYYDFEIGRRELALVRKTCCIERCEFSARRRAMFGIHAAYRSSDIAIRNMAIVEVGACG